MPIIAIAIVARNGVLGDGHGNRSSSPRTGPGSERSPWAIRW